MKRTLIILTAFLGAGVDRAVRCAERERAADRGSRFTPGKIVDGQAKNGVTYHVRLPAGPLPKGVKTRPALVILHGSNMNARNYLETTAQRWPKLAEDYVLLGINGEKRVAGSPDSQPTYNYTYVNFMGKSRYQGYPGTDRESPALIAEVVEELKPELGLGKIFIGGHSQGGFCSYISFMTYPQLFSGVFPVSAGLLIQAEPAAYQDDEIRKLQRGGAVAIVHGENDGLVAFSMGQSAYQAFQDEGFPRLRFFTHKHAAHMFAMLPVEEAVRWLEAITADDPAQLIEFASRRLKEGETRDASAALARAREIDAKKKFQGRIKTLQDTLEKPAGAAAKKLEKTIAAAKDGSWVEEFLEFRWKFELTQSAQKLMAAYLKLRAEHQEPAQKLWGEARQSFQSGNKEQGYAKCEEIVKKLFASSYYHYAKNALKERK